MDKCEGYFVGHCDNEELKVYFDNDEFEYIVKKN